MVVGELSVGDLNLPGCFSTREPEYLHVSFCLLLVSVSCATMSSLAQWKRTLGSGDLVAPTVLLSLAYNTAFFLHSLKASKLEPVVSFENSTFAFSEFYLIFAVTVQLFSFRFMVL